MTDKQIEDNATAADIKDEQTNFNNEDPNCNECKLRVCGIECVTYAGVNPMNIGEPTSKIIKALKFIKDRPLDYSDIVDKIARILAGDEFDAFITNGGATGGKPVV